jgi:hypothetical protein
MKRLVLKLGVLGVLSGVFVAVSNAAAVTPEVNKPACCASGAASCCGSVCAAGGGKCTAQ